MNQYILVEKQPVYEPDLTRWGNWMRDNDRHVALDEIGIFRVSTVFLGLDHSFMGGPPLLFETMVFGGPLNMEMDRYHTWREAEAGHKAMVERVKAESEGK